MQHSWGIVVIVCGELRPQISAKLSQKSTLRKKFLSCSVGRCVDFFVGRKGVIVRCVGGVTRGERPKKHEKFCKIGKNNYLCTRKCTAG